MDTLGVERLEDGYVQGGAVHFHLGIQLTLAHKKSRNDGEGAASDIIKCFCCLNVAVTSTQRGYGLPQLMGTRASEKT